ncbi:MAG: porphobilinogen synthase [Trueperaceae bacterium]
MTTSGSKPVARSSAVADLPLPRERPRRLRGSASLRALVTETRLAPEQLVAPFFVVPESGQEQPVASLPGVSRFSVDRLLPELERALKLGVRSAVLFGVLPDRDKNDWAGRADDPDGPVASALREARRQFGNDLALITDVCLCGYTDHGHCGLLGHSPRGVHIDNDSSLGRLAEMALAHAEAGADLVSPSDMMDGRVAAIRTALDGAGHSDVGILSYAVKYASAFYGPFREAAGSAPKGDAALGSTAGSGGVPSDRRSYQMDPANAREAMREAALDEAEGADMLMVKPALPYLDVLARLRPATDLPLVAYQVSGEYAMLKAAAAAGVLQEADAVRESLLAIRRAGADLILSYYAVEALEKGWLNS